VVPTSVDATSLPHSAPGFVGLADKKDVKKIMSQRRALDEIAVEDCLSCIHPDCDPLVRKLVCNGYRYIVNDIQ
jgi:hypothetical protein